MAPIEKPDMPILRESANEIYQRMVNRAVALAQTRGQTPPAVEEGEFFYDLWYPVAEEISEQQQLLEYAFLQGFLPWADGEYLDAHGELIGLVRKELEEDDPYRERLIERARTEEGNGRSLDYESWALAVNGVGSAIAIEKERNDVSIDIYITDPLGQPATLEFCQQVRDSLESKRIAGHDLKVNPATIFVVNVTVRLILVEGSDINMVQDLIAKEINNYIRGRTTIVYQQVGTLFFVDGVSDYADYTLNGGNVNIVVPVNTVPVLSLVITT